MLEQSLLFTGFSSIQFLNSPLFLNIVSQNTFGTLPLTVQYLCDLQDVMPLHWSPCTSAHILSLLATSLIHNSGLILICVKYLSKFLPSPLQKKKIFSKVAPTKNEISKLFSKKIYLQNCNLKNIFSKLLPQKISF